MLGICISTILLFILIPCITEIESNQEGEFYVNSNHNKTS